MPDIDGMGDFSRHLGNSLWEEYDIKSHYLVYRRPELELDRKNIAPYSISYPLAPTPAAFLAHISQLRAKNIFDAVLLHYGPYAYSPDGKPKAFAKAIATLAKEIKVIVYFHELYSFGKPWRRAFWTNREQQQCVTELMVNAKVCLTSNSEYIQKLERLNIKSRTIVKLPVISNVGEPQNVTPLAGRAKQMVVFGQLHGRTRLYENHAHSVAELCRILDIETIIDVGSGDTAKIPKQIDQIPVQILGRLDDERLSHLLANSVAGVIGYWPDVWEKSGVMAAYQAHAMVPILVPLERRRTPIPSFVPYVVAENLRRAASRSGSISNAEMQSIADAAHSYYIANQSVNRCAKIIASLIWLKSTI
jgi:hypothetical protein